MALQWFQASESHMEVPYGLVLDEAQCHKAGMPTHVKEFRLGETVSHIRASSGSAIGLSVLSSQCCLLCCHLAVGRHCDGKGKEGLMRINPYKMKNSYSVMG